MSKHQTDALIKLTAKRLFAQAGYDGVSMRELAQKSGVGLSSIYHFFADKDVLLRMIYGEINKQLGVERQELPKQPSAEKMLAQLIDFQFKHIEDIVYVLKYYLHFRRDFAALPTKTLPPKSLLHVEEVIRLGREAGEYHLTDRELTARARVIAHTINGYLLEYYPLVPDEGELRGIKQDIVHFARAGLRN